MEKRKKREQKQKQKENNEKEAKRNTDNYMATVLDSSNSINSHPTVTDTQRLWPLDHSLDDNRRRKFRLSTFVNISR